MSARNEIEAYRPSPFDYTSGDCKDTTTFSEHAKIAREIPSRYGQRGVGSIESTCTDGSHILRSLVFDGSVVRESITFMP